MTRPDHLIEDERDEPPDDAPTADEERWEEGDWLLDCLIDAEATRERR